MKSVANVAIHSSQFPENVRRDLIESLRSRQINHKFHYDSIKQTQKWLALQEACSPARTDPGCAATYERSFEDAVARIPAGHVQVISLGCGGGQKDARLLKLLRSAGKEVLYVPSDISVAMVLVAQQAALEVNSSNHCFPLVCDLATAEDLPAVFDQLPTNPSGGEAGSTVLSPRDTARLLVFFGMIPNFEPERIMPRLSSLIRPHDYLLFSANLAPGSDYALGVQRILPLYDNHLTRDWLMTFLLDLGAEHTDGELHFSVQQNAAGLRRIAADFQFTRPRRLQVDARSFDFAAGEIMHLFFSYRYTPALVRTLFRNHRLRILQEWITRSEEEGVFLACLE